MSARKKTQDMGCEYHFNMFNITSIILLYMGGLSKFNLYSVGQPYICYLYLELFNIQHHGSLDINLNTSFLYLSHIMADYVSSRKCEKKISNIMCWDIDMVELTQVFTLG